VQCNGIPLEGWGGPLQFRLQLDKILVAQGELYRLLTVVLVHGGIAHLLFNMFALWYSGQLVERMYGSRLMLVFYVLGGISGSMSSFVFGEGAWGVGASGAIFALFGIVLVATRYHHAVLDVRSRAIASQVGFLIVLNLAAGFAGIFGNVDNAAHVGGLVAGAWLALAIPPSQVQTLASIWQSPNGGQASRLITVGRPLLATAALAAVLAAGFVIGADRWKGMVDPWRVCGFTQSAEHVAAAPAQASPSLEDR
jgi:membrane associated rhomboid family serine protease